MKQRLLLWVVILLFSLQAMGVDTVELYTPAQLKKITDQTGSLKWEIDQLTILDPTLTNPGTPTKLKEQEAEVRRVRKDFPETKDFEINIVRPAELEVEIFEDEVKKLRTAASNARGGFTWGIGEGTGDSATNIELEKKEKILGKMKNQLKLAQLALNERQRLHEKLMSDDGIDVHTELTKNAVEKLQSQLKAVKGQLNFDKLYRRLNNLDDTLDEVQRVYDKSIIGAYIQEKMGRLLNSQVFCQARQRCEKAQRGKNLIDPKLIREQIFPEAKQNSKRSFQYYKNKARQAKQ